MKGFPSALFVPIPFCLDFVDILWNSQGSERGLWRENRRKRIGDRDWCFLSIRQRWESAGVVVTLVSRAGLLFQWWKGLSGVKYGQRGWLSCLRETGKKTTHSPEEKWSPFFNTIYIFACLSIIFFPACLRSFLLSPILQLKGRRKIPSLRQGRRRSFSSL